MAEPCPVLPDHVIEDVLARLPAKSVLRCRCLSRTWVAMLSSDDFADRHLRLANRDAPPKIQDWSPDHPGGTTLMDVPHALTRRHFCLLSLFGPFGRRDQRSHKPNSPLVPRLATQQYRGLVILEATDTEVYYLFNPSTDQMAAHHKYTSLGIGYDMLIKKHKVVCIYYRGSDVYVVNSTGLWRLANGGAPPGWVSRNETGVFVQGHAHWMAKSKLDASSNEMFIITFSLGDETFRAVPLPLGMGTERNSLAMHQLTELDGRLCLFSTECEFIRSPKRYYVWLLHGHGETSTWDLHCRIIWTCCQPTRHDQQWSPRRPRARTLPHGPYSELPLAVYNHATGDMENLLDSSGLVSNKHMKFGHDIIFAMSLVLRELSKYTLARLKCVCWSWLAMIESNDFLETRCYMTPFSYIF
ncbi:hypothetical protein VPH35_138969 [Triticum aestivum]